MLPNEVSVHEQEYGFEGSFLEDELFATDEEDDDDDDEVEGECQKDDKEIQLFGRHNLVSRT